MSGAAGSGDGLAAHNEAALWCMSYKQASLKYCAESAVG